MKGIIMHPLTIDGLKAGRKTQTRRVLNPQPVKGWMDNTKQFSPDGRMFDRIKKKQLYWIEGVDGKEVKPRYKIGEFVYVKEAYAHTSQLNLNPEDENYGYVYKADGEPWGDIEGWKWKSPLFMPQSASRFILRIKDIRVEKLNEISISDSIAEGIEFQNVDTERLEGGELVADFMNYCWVDDGKYEDYHFPYYPNPILSYKSLWKVINPGVEFSDQFVWVYEFEVIEDWLLYKDKVYEKKEIV